MPDVAKAHADFAKIIAEHKPHIIMFGYADEKDYAELSRTTGEIADAVRVYLRAVIADASDCSKISLPGMGVVKDVHLDLDMLHSDITSLFDQAAEEYLRVEAEDK